MNWTELIIGGLIGAVLCYLYFYNGARNTGFKDGHLAGFVEATCKGKTVYGEKEARLLKEKTELAEKAEKLENKIKEDAKNAAALIALNKLDMDQRVESRRGELEADYNLSRVAFGSEFLGLKIPDPEPTKHQEPKAALPTPPELEPPQPQLADNKLAEELEEPAQEPPTTTSTPERILTLLKEKPRTQKELTQIIGKKSTVSMALKQLRKTGKVENISGVYHGK